MLARLLLLNKNIKLQQRLKLLPQLMQRDEQDKQPSQLQHQYTRLQTQDLMQVHKADANVDARHIAEHVVIKISVKHVVIKL